MLPGHPFCPCDRSLCPAPLSSKIFDPRCTCGLERRDHVPVWWRFQRGLNVSLKLCREKNSISVSELVFSRKDFARNAEGFSGSVPIRNKTVSDTRFKKFKGTQFQVKNNVHICRQVASFSYSCTRVKQYLPKSQSFTQHILPAQSQLTKWLRWREENANQRVEACAWTPKYVKHYNAERRLIPCPLRIVFYCSGNVWASQYFLSIPRKSVFQKRCIEQVYRITKKKASVQNVVSRFFTPSDKHMYAVHVYLLPCLHETRLCEVNAFHNSKMWRSTIEMLI